jgi:hypothetical protein
VLGRHKDGVACGGLEGVGADTERAFVRAAAGYKHVFFEGLRASLTHQPWVKLAEDLNRAGAPAIPFVILTMNTPFEVCMERVQTIARASRLCRTTALRHFSLKVQRGPQRRRADRAEAGRTSRWIKASKSRRECLPQLRSH